LISLDGVGSKTAACVLIFSFNFPIIPADTHVHRLSNRIGVVDGSTREKTQELLQDDTRYLRLLSRNIIKRKLNVFK